MNKKKINWKKVRKNLFPHWQKAAPGILTFVSCIAAIQLSSIIAPAFTSHKATLVVFGAITVYAANKWRLKEDELRRTISGAKRIQLQLDAEVIRHKEVEELLLKMLKVEKVEYEASTINPRGQRQEF